MGRVPPCQCSNGCVDLARPLYEAFGSAAVQFSENMTTEHLYAKLHRSRPGWRLIRIGRLGHHHLCNHVHLKRTSPCTAAAAPPRSSERILPTAYQLKGGCSTLTTFSSANPARWAIATTCGPILVRQCSTCRRVTPKPQQSNDQIGGHHQNVIASCSLVILPI